ncbi:MAG TPA: 4-hydroxy-tetrahydrodipicolinate synthase [Bdellovibrionota bacterium]|jgi:4-hydroxy-tetrahydrodipicolinate synthase|nr:4-hydroxy-tetrahydrodipicolinate synthase [Bdellovibrionota bacterium]
MSHPLATNHRTFPLWTALVTPFLANGLIDWVSLETLLDEQINAKNGVLLLGSTGEALNMSLNEKKSLLEFALPKLKSTPVMVGLAGFEEAANLEWLAYLEKLPIDGYLAITPIYAKPGRHGQTAWFEKILNASSRPVMLYNVPSRSGVKLHPETVADLGAHKNFWSIKEASGSLDDMKLYLSKCQSQVIFCGDDGLCPDFCDAGAIGLVSVASNAWPTATHRYVRRCLESSLSGEERASWAESADALFVASNPVPVKALLHHEGRIATNTMRSPLQNKDLATYQPIAQASEFVNAWHKENPA